MSHYLALGIAVVIAGLLLWLLRTIIVMVAPAWRDIVRDWRRDRSIDQRDQEVMRGELSTWDRF